MSKFNWTFVGLMSVAFAILTSGPLAVYAEKLMKPRLEYIAVADGLAVIDHQEFEFRYCLMHGGCTKFQKLLGKTSIP